MQNTDAFLWAMESNPVLRSTIVTISLLDSTPDWGELVERFDGLSRRLPTFRQRIVSSPRPAPPRWADCPEFDLGFHMRRVTAPQPGTLDAVLEMGRLAAMSDFDRARPLWEITLIDGLADGGAALMTKMHHSLADGIGGVQIAMTLFDVTARRRGALPVAPTTYAVAAGRTARHTPLRRRAARQCGNGFGYGSSRRGAKRRAAAGADSHLRGGAHVVDLPHHAADHQARLVAHERPHDGPSPRDP